MSNFTKESLLTLCQRLGTDLAYLDSLAQKVGVSLFPEWLSDPTGLTAFQLFDVVEQHLDVVAPRSSLLINDPIITQRNQLHDALDHVIVNLTAALTPPPDELTTTLMLDSFQATKNIRFIGGMFYLIPNIIQENSVDLAEWGVVRERIDAFCININRSIALMPDATEGKFDIAPYEGKPITEVIDAIEKFADTHPEYNHVASMLVHTFISLLMYVRVNIFEESLDESLTVGEYESNKIVQIVKYNQPSYIFGVVNYIKSQCFISNVV